MDWRGFVLTPYNWGPGGGGGWNPQIFLHSCYYGRFVVEVHRLTGDVVESTETYPKTVEDRSDQDNVTCPTRFSSLYTMTRLTRGLYGLYVPDRILYLESARTSVSFPPPEKPAIFLMVRKWRSGEWSVLPIK